MISTRALAHIITQEVPTALTLERAQRGADRINSNLKASRGEQKAHRRRRGDKSTLALALCRAYSLDKLIRFGSEDCLNSCCKTPMNCCLPLPASPALLRNVGEINLLPFGKNLHSTHAGMLLIHMLHSLRHESTHSPACCCCCL